MPLKLATLGHDPQTLLFDIYPASRNHRARYPTFSLRNRSKPLERIMPRLLKTCTLHGAFDDAFLPDPFSSSFVFSDDKYFKTLGDEAARRDRITTHNAYHEFLSKKKFNSPHSKDTGPSFRSFNSAGRKPLFPPIVSVDLLKSTRRRPFLTVRSRTKALNKSLYDLPESQSKPRQLSEPSVIERIRWKNAILVYIQFDPWNKVCCRI